MKIERKQHWYCKHFTDTVITDNANSLDEWLSINSDYTNNLPQEIEQKITLLLDKKNWKTKSQKKIDKMKEVFDCIVCLRFHNGEYLTCTKVIKKSILNIAL